MIRPPVKAMILCAGRGERMRPFTDRVPKPLIEVGGRPLVEHHLLNLAAVGVREFVINLGWLGASLRERLGDGARFGVRIDYSEEGWPALETGGGVARALPLLGPRQFLLVNGDVYADFDWAALYARAQSLPAADLAHLLLVANPPHNPSGDFGLADSRIRNAPRTHTFSGVSIHRPELFRDSPDGAFPMLPLWRAAAEDGRLGGEIASGHWSDVGTPQRLAALEADLHPQEKTS